MRKDKHLPHLDASAWDHIIVPVSGGKDSQALLSLTLATPGAAEKIMVCHQFTGYDHSLTNAHLKYMSTFYDVDIVTTRHDKFVDVFDLIRKSEYFPSSVARNCTSRLKIQPFARSLYEQGYHKKRTLILLGMRAAESRNRASQYGDIASSDYFSICDISRDYQKRLKSIQVSLPIVHFSENEVFDYIASTGAKVNPLYKRGHKRVGCYPCLLAGDTEWALASTDPEGRAHIEELLKIEADFAAHPTGKKLIKIHPTRDVKALMARPPAPDPFGFHSKPTDEDGCALCNI